MLFIYMDEGAETKTTVTGTAAFKHHRTLFPHSCTPASVSAIAPLIYPTDIHRIHLNPSKLQLETV